MIHHRSLFTTLVVLSLTTTRAQDTFSIVAVDTVTGEVGSAGASCVDLFMKSYASNDFIGDLFPGVGAINTQASYLPSNQTNARGRMVAGDTPAQIIAWLQAHDSEADMNASGRQYGVVRLKGTGAQSAAHTGAACPGYAGQRVGANYAIQGNTLLGAAVLDRMEANFRSTAGPLAHKLMAAMQGAKVAGADSRCASNNTSSLFAYLKVSAPGDAEGAPVINLGVRLHDGTGIEPIDSLQHLFDVTVGTGDGLWQLSPGVVYDAERKEITVPVPEEVSEKGELRLYDRSGNPLAVRARWEKHTLRIDVSRLKSGLYHVIWVVDATVSMRAHFVKP